MIIKRDTQLIAYVGGIDLLTTRWDTWQHRFKAPFPDSPIYRQQYRGHREKNVYGWIDEAQRLEGPAAWDVLMNFLDRWNDPERPKLYRFAKKYAKMPKEWPILDAPTDVDVVGRGTQSVQIVRTFSCTKHYGPFAPKGEFSLYHARLKAIGLAQNYIYIVDQYFLYHEQLLQALLKALPRLQKLIIFCRDDPFDFKGYDKFQFEQIRALQLAAPLKVHVFTPQDPTIYIHSKTLVIDDLFLAIGSSNWNSRSMESDSELAAHVVDRDYMTSPDGTVVGKYVFHFRLQKWAEMASVHPKVMENMSLLEAVEFLETRARHPRALLRVYQAEKKMHYALYGRVVQRLTDYSQQCHSKQQRDAQDHCDRPDFLKDLPSHVHVLCKCLRQGLVPFAGGCHYME